MWNGERVQQPLRRTVRNFTLVACGTCVYKCCHIFLDCWPPKASLEELKSARSTRMTSETRGVPSLEDLGAGRFRNKQTVGWPPSWVRFSGLGLFDSIFQIPPYRSYYLGTGDNRCNRIFLGSVSIYSG